MENILSDDDILQEKQRSAKFNQEEMDLLKGLIKKYKHIILNKKTGKVHPKQREEAWESLTVEFNNDPTCTKSRSVTQLKNKWDYMKRSAKKDLAAYKRERESHTGDDRGTSPLDDTSLNSLDTFRESVEGVPSYSDRDLFSRVVEDSETVDILTPTLPEVYQSIYQRNCHASTPTGIGEEEKSTSLKDTSQNRKRKLSEINRPSPQYTRSKFVELAERKMKILDDKEEYAKYKASVELEILNKKSENASLEKKKLVLECVAQNLEINIKRLILKKKELEVFLLEKELYR